MEELHRHWETYTRYYAAELKLDLFGEWIIEKNWGGKFTRRRGGQVKRFSSYEKGLQSFKELSNLRNLHGYRII